MQMLAIGGAIQDIQNWIVALGAPELLAFILTAAVCVAGATVLSVALMAGLWRYRKTLLRDRDIKLTRFTAPGFPAITFLNALRIPVPKFSFDLSGFKGIGTAMAFVGLAFVAAFTFVIAGTNDTPVWPEAGAAYHLPDVHGINLEPDPENPTDRNQTLQINLGNGVRLDRLVLKNLQLGKAGLSSAFKIERASTVTGAHVNVGTFTITNAAIPTLDWANMEVGTVVLAPYTDGHTNAISVDSTISNLVIDSDRGAGTYVAEDSVVDRILITLQGDSGAFIGEVIVDNVDASVGNWDWDYLKIGTLTMNNTNLIGNGTGVNVASAVWNSSISARNIQDSTIDTPLTVQ